jgi:opacity protein-like surface antigen
MRTLTCSCVVAALLAGASPLCVAAGNALEGAYLGLGVGAARAVFKQDDFASGVPGITESKDASEVGYKLYFGAKAHRNLWIELGRSNFGRFSHRYEATPDDFLVQEYKVTGWGLSLMPTLPLGPVSLFARVGLFRSDTISQVGTSSATVAAAIAGTPAGDSFRKTKKSTLLGAGMQIDLPGALGIRLDYEDYGDVGDQDNTGRARLRMLTAGLLYRF